MDRPLSSLEYTALGVILKRGPCRAHAVVTEFAGSQTFAYRSGAGSVYPLLKRLCESGLVKLVDKRYSLTPKGIEALREWLRPPFPEADLSTNLDVLRSRAYFLKLLSPAEIRVFAEYGRAKLGELLRQCEKTRAAYRDAGDTYSEMAMAGTEHETRARIAWLGEIAERLGSDSPSG